MTKNWQTDWTPKDLEKVDGYLWPKIATKYRHRYHRHAPDMEAALRFAKGAQYVLQAGGNVGVWANWLADRGYQVWTAEPDPMNFYCLARNAWRPNIRKFQAALGEHAEPVAMNFHAGNIGAHNVIPDAAPATPGLTVSQIRIDDLGMPRCDLMVLDIEGWEFPALRGARETIAKWHPVIQLEERGHSEKLGQGTFAEIAAWLTGLGYREVNRVAKDIIFAAD